MLTRLRAADGGLQAHRALDVGAIALCYLLIPRPARCYLTFVVCEGTPSLGGPLGRWEWGGVGVRLRDASAGRTTASLFVVFYKLLRVLSE